MNIIESIKNNEQTYDVFVEWTGEYPCLCSGIWRILINGKALSIPQSLSNEPMRTYGTYEELIDYATEEFETYRDGFEYEEWIKENRYWIDKGLLDLNIKPSESLYRDLYEKINEEDWRYNSCGGCI